MRTTQSTGLLVGISGVIGAAAFWRRRQKNADLPAADTGPDPAEELRAKLAESRTTDEAVAEAEAAPPDPAARRQSVHDRARASIDDLK